MVMAGDYENEILCGEKYVHMLYGHEFDTEIHTRSKIEARPLSNL